MLATAIGIGLILLWGGTLMWLSGTFLRDINCKLQPSRERLWIVFGFAVAAPLFLRLVHLLVDHQ